ncbi:uncharacterized protein JCM6883_000651 [Sporobolomyces salmoneus]|uniref:uncharacterized protein n=1 Tax=Sporobolomyces salmoneus TaxID=183962 RepID=UPI003174FD7A
MEDTDLPLSEPIASTSRAVFTLPYKPELAEEVSESSPPLDTTRVKQYEQAWSICQSRIQSTLSSLHDASLDRIINFVRSSSSSDSDSLALYTALTGGTIPLKTGLILGASPGSSSLIYNSLIRQLVYPSAEAAAERAKPVLVSRLTSRECSNIKNALRSLIAGFVGSDAELELDDEDEEDEIIHARQRSSALLKSTLMVPEDLQNLVAWYEHRYGKKGKDQAPTLVVLLEDLEAMDGKVLNQLVAALSHYTATLPLVLLLGVATTPTALYNLLPQQTTNRLDVSQFFVDPGIGAFNALVRGVFVDSQAPLGLGPKAFTDLYRSFEDIHHSINSTITWIQCLYLNHFLSSSLAPLAVVNESSISSSATTRNRLSDVLSQAKVPSLGTDLPTLEAVVNARKELEELVKLRSEAFEGLLGMLEFWEKKRSVENCLFLLLGSTGGGEQNGMKKLVDELCGLILQASSTKLPAFLRTMTNRLKTFHDSATLGPSTSLLDFLQTQSETLTDILAKPKPSGRSNLINVHLAGGGGANHLPGFGELTGAARSSGVTDIDRQFSKVAKDTSDGLKERLKDALKPCSEIKGYEIFYSDDTSASKRLNPSPLPSIIKTLTKLDPLSSNSSFANHSTGSPRPDSIEPIPLDLAIAYRVYKDLNSQGRLINLGDWWAGFELGAGDEPPLNATESTTAKKNDSSSKKGKGKKRRRTTEEESEEEDEEEEDDEDGPARRKQARFLRAVADLAHLGFVYPSTRKPEHVLKSIY